MILATHGSKYFSLKLLWPRLCVIIYYFSISQLYYKQRVTLFLLLGILRRMCVSGIESSWSGKSLPNFRFISRVIDKKIFYDVTENREQ